MVSGPGWWPVQRASIAAVRELANVLTLMVL
jgi:hypothetical protein